MNNDINRIIIENAVRLNLRNFDFDDKRCIRKLIDTGIHLTGKNDEEGIFVSIGELFRDENSMYYPAVAKLMKNYDKDKFIHFGINLGYNTFNKAARTIRQRSAQYNKTIPWIADMDVTPENESGYSTATFSKLTNHYITLGVNAYIMRFGSEVSESAYINILTIIRQEEYANFLLMLPDEVIPDSILERMATLKNILVSLPISGKYTEQNRRRLADNKVLSAVRYVVDNDYPGEILKNTSETGSGSDSAASPEADKTSLLSRVASYESPILILETSPEMTADDVKRFNAGIPVLRKNPPEPVFIIDLAYDIQNINKMISGKEISTHITVKPAVSSQV